MNIERVSCGYAKRGKDGQAGEYGTRWKGSLSLFTVFRNLRPTNARNLLPRIEPPAPRHIMALFHLAVSGPMSVSELATHLGVTLTTASLSVTQMAAAGLVIREEDPTDHRRTIVSISPNIEPTISFDDKSDQVSVSMLMFTKWGGFYRRTYTFKEGFPHKILNKQDQFLIEYDCGVKF